MYIVKIIVHRTFKTLCTTVLVSVNYKNKLPSVLLILEKVFIEHIIMIVEQ